MKKSLFLAFAFMVSMAPNFGQMAIQNTGISSPSLDRFDDFKKKKKKKKKDGETEADWKKKVWYGSGLSLGLGANGQSSVWQIGVSPMAGYKVLPWFSVGPRIGYFFGQERFRVNATQVGRQNVRVSHVGAMARVKVWHVFLHLENSFFWQKVSEKGGGQSFTLFDDNFANQFIGLGYSPTDGRNEFAMEYLLVVDMRQARANDPGRLPIEYRVGLTYNF